VEEEEVEEGLRRERDILYFTFEGDIRLVGSSSHTGHTHMDPLSSPPFIRIPASMLTECLSPGN
jgi:hypothetical protein